MYRGKKFNSKKEDVPEDTYLGIMVFRFYVACQRCNALMSFKTDPQNSDYVCEHGASRNFEPWRAKQDAEEELTEEQEKKEEQDAMNRLERVTKESKMDEVIMDGLDEIKMLNAANNNISVDQLLQNLKEQDQVAAQAEEDEETAAFKAEAKAAFENRKLQTKRVEEQPADVALGKPSTTSIWGDKAKKQDGPAQVAPKQPPKRIVGVKRKLDTPSTQPTGGGGLVADYPSSSSPSGSQSPNKD